MDITAISDLHGHYPELEGGDLLIVAGDLTARDTPEEWARYFLWQGDLPYKKIIFIGGNHDNRLQKIDMSFYSPDHKVDYLCDSGTEFEYEAPSSNEWGGKEGPMGAVAYEKKKLKIWGSPWTKRFKGMNPHCMAFTVDTEEELAEKWALIPDDVDILVTHCGMGSMLDETTWGENVGSPSLFQWFLNRKTKNLKLHVCGHVHESYGQMEHHQVMHINASHVNEHYQPVNKPIRIEL